MDEELSPESYLQSIYYTVKPLNSDLHGTEELVLISEVSLLQAS